MKLCISIIRFSRYKVIVYSATGGGRHMGGGGGGGNRGGGASRGGGGLHSSARVTCAMLHIVIIWGLSILLSLPLIFAMELGWSQSWSLSKVGRNNAESLPN